MLRRVVLRPLGFEIQRFLRKVCLLADMNTWNPNKKIRAVIMLKVNPIDNRLDPVIDKIDCIFQQTRLNCNQIPMETYTTPEEREEQIDFEQST